MLALAAHILKISLKCQQLLLYILINNLLWQSHTPGSQGGLILFCCKHAYFMLWLVFEIWPLVLIPQMGLELRYVIHLVALILLLTNMALMVWPKRFDLGINLTECKYAFPIYCLVLIFLAVYFRATWVWGFCRGNTMRSWVVLKWSYGECRLSVSLLKDHWKLYSA